MPAKRQRISVPETRNHIPENTNKKSASRGRPGGVGCFGLPPVPVTLYLADLDAKNDSILGTENWYLQANTTILPYQTLIIKSGQFLLTYKPNTSQKAFTLTNNGTIVNGGIIITTTPFINTGTITCNNQGQIQQGQIQLNSTVNNNSGGIILNNGYLTIVGGFNNTGTIKSIVNTNSSIGMYGSGSFNNNGTITMNNSTDVIIIGLTGGVTLTNAGTINSGGNIYIGNYAGNITTSTLINTNTGTITNTGSITKSSGSTFTNNGGTYNGPLPV